MIFIFFIIESRYTGGSTFPIAIATGVRAQWPCVPLVSTDLIGDLVEKSFLWTTSDNRDFHSLHESPSLLLLCVRLPKMIFLTTNAHRLCVVAVAVALLARWRRCLCKREQIADKMRGYLPLIGLTNATWMHTRFHTIQQSYIPSVCDLRLGNEYGWMDG